MSSFSLSHAPNFESYGAVHTNPINRDEIHLSHSGARSLLTPGVKMVFFDKNSNRENGQFYLELPISSFSARSRAGKPESYDQVETELSEISYGLRCGVLLRTYKHLFVSLGYSYEHVQLDFMASDGGEKGSFSAPASKTGGLFGINFIVSRNLELSAQLYTMKNSVDSKTISLGGPDNENDINSEVQIKANDNYNVEIKITLRW